MVFHTAALLKSPHSLRALLKSPPLSVLTDIFQEDLGYPALESLHSGTVFYPDP